MQTYFDLLPIELLGLLVPSKNVQTFLQVFENSEKRYAIFVAYVQHAYPYYYKLYSTEHPNIHFHDVMKMLFDHYTTGDNVYGPINDIKDDLIIIKTNLIYDQKPPEHYDWTWPIILQKDFPLVLKYLLSHPEISAEYGPHFYYDVTTTLIITGGNLFGMIGWGVSDDLKIKLLQLSGYTIGNLIIQNDDLGDIEDTPLGQYLIKNNVMRYN